MPAHQKKIPLLRSPSLGTGGVDFGIKQNLRKLRKGGIVRGQKGYERILKSKHPAPKVGYFLPLFMLYLRMADNENGTNVDVVY